MRCCTLLEDGPLLLVFANGRAVSFVDGNVLPADLLVAMLSQAESGCRVRKHKPIGYMYVKITGSQEGNHEGPPHMQDDSSRRSEKETKAKYD